MPLVEVEVARVQVSQRAVVASNEFLNLWINRPDDTAIN